MKGIIMAIAIAAGMALGGAASGQTQKEVNEIIRRAKRIGLADEGQCLRKDAGNKFYYWGITRTIKEIHSTQVLRAKVSDSQINEAVCRYMNGMK